LVAFKVFRVCVCEKTIMFLAHLTATATDSTTWSVILPPSLLKMAC
jgi:hypothetical protein